MGPKISLFSQIPFPDGSNRHHTNGGRGILCLSPLETIEILNYIVRVKKVEIPARIKPIIITHEDKEPEGEKLENEGLKYVKIFWTEGNKEAFCLFNTLDLLIQLAPEEISRYFLNKKAAQVAVQEDAQCL